MESNTVLQRRKEEREEQDTIDLSNLKPAVRKAMEDGDPVEVLNALTPLQRRFCEEYSRSFKPQESAIAAGYAKTYANRQAYQNLQNPAIRYAIDGILLERYQENAVTIQQLVNRFMKVADKAAEEGNLNAEIAALDRLGKHLGMFVERTEITGKDGEAIKYEKAQQDAADFTGAILSLAKRSGAREDSSSENT